MPPPQNYLNSDIGTVDIAVHNEEPVVAFTENKLLTIKKYSFNSVTNTDERSSDIPFMTCFPNPTHGVINIQTQKTGGHSIKLSSLTGRIVYNQDFNGNAMRIDLSSFQRGIYFITLETESIVETRRIIKL
jgi:hypothetical protein